MPGESSSTALAMPGSDDGSNFSDTTAASSSAAASGTVSAPSGFAAALPLLRANLAGEVLQEATGAPCKLCCPFTCVFVYWTPRMCSRGAYGRCCVLWRGPTCAAVPCSPLIAG